MKHATASIADPVALLNALSADAIERRVHELHHEEVALRVLLRSARARERHITRAKSLDADEGGGQR
jgi:hypothetical protein